MQYENQDTIREDRKGLMPVRLSIGNLMVLEDDGTLDEMLQIKT